MHASEGEFVQDFPMDQLLLDGGGCHGEPALVILMSARNEL